MIYEDLKVAIFHRELCLFDGGNTLLLVTRSYFGVYKYILILLHAIARKKAHQIIHYSCVQRVEKLCNNNISILLKTSLCMKHNISILLL